MTSGAPFGEGDILAGKFRVVRAVGSGGMGLVLEAEHLDLGRRVALKLMLNSSSAGDAEVTRFFREARAAARLDDHVAKVLDVGRLDSGAPYLVMELLAGRNLQVLLSECGALPVSEAVDYALEACEALAEAHAAGIVHRDIKPANLFRATDAYGDHLIKLLDFGISKVLSDGNPGDPQLTDSRALMGSPVYMSPEQLQSSRTVDHRSDVWSLGALLFELISGRAVWSGQSLADLILQIANDRAPSLAACVATVPAGLAAVVARCLEKNPAQRFQHIADLAVALAPFGSERAQRTLARVLRLSNGGAPAQTTVDVPVWPREGPARAQGTLQGTAAAASSRAGGNSRRLAVAVALLLLTASVLILAVRARVRREPARAVGVEVRPPPASSSPPAAPAQGVPKLAAPLGADDRVLVGATPSVSAKPAVRTQPTPKPPSATLNRPHPASPEPAPAADPMSIRR